MVLANVGAVPVVSNSPTFQPVCGPTRLRLPNLLHIANRTVDEVRGRHYDPLLPRGGVPTNNRWWVWLHLDDEIDIQLISWVPPETAMSYDEVTGYHTLCRQRSEVIDRPEKFGKQ
jgi:hypothetical protein